MDKKLSILSNNDLVLGELIRRVGQLEMTKENDFYQSLVRSIIGLQLSVKAADTIFSRFITLSHGVVEPRVSLNLTDEEIRSIGVSFQKISYIKDLSIKILVRDIVLEELNNLSNTEVISTLTQVRGIGKWTAEMFLIFSLGRENVLSLADVGLQRGASWLYDNEDGKSVLLQKEKQWDPYQSIASLYIWEVINLGWVNRYDSFKDYCQKATD